MKRGISRWTAVGVSLLLLSSLAFATGTTEVDSPADTTVETGRYPMEVTDGVGNTMTIAAKPQSIISLSLFSDEVLFDLVDPSRLAGASSLAADPVYSNVAERAAAIEPRVDFNVEQIIGIYPDIVFAANWSEADKIAQLRDAGIVVYQVDTPFSVDGIKAGIRALAEIVGEDEAGEAIIDQMDTRIAALSEAVATIPAGERSQAVDYNNWGTANGVDTTWNEVLRLAGVENAVGEFQAGDFGQVPLSKELLIDLDPEVIFLPGYIWGEENGAEAFRLQVTNDPAFADLQAIRSDMVFSVPENLKGTYSQYLVDAAEFVARRTYPDLF